MGLYEGPWLEFCDDEEDNDRDDLIDCLDPDCDSFHCCDGTLFNEYCNNRRDDDCDGLVDCEDPDCDSYEACGEL